MIFKCSYSDQIWCLRVTVHLLSFSEGYMFWKCCTRIEYEVSMKNKLKYIWSLATYICEKLKKKLLWSMHWRLHYHWMLSDKSKNYAISLLCNITQIWHLLSVSARNIIYLAVIWVRLYKKKLLWSNTEDYTVTRNGVLLKWL